MNFNPSTIFEEYKAGTQFKTTLGNKGVFEQTKINERFFIGDQWHGAKCGTERPLVRHNIIKRIGDYKMSQILSDNLTVNFSADGIPTADSKDYSYDEQGTLNEQEISAVMQVFSDYYDVTAERVNLDALNLCALRNAYISGSSLLYTYWDSSIDTGLFADNEKTAKVKGDIRCEVLKIEDVVFGDPYCENLQDQPYIIISSRRKLENVTAEARLHGADLATLTNIEQSATDGKITVFTKFYKKYNQDGSVFVAAAKVTENAIVRKEFSTGLRLYPLALLNWETRNNCIYGESEITYLIPNQIAINRMITANVWSAMTSGMPIMLVNGDTVTEKITNDPGQIIKIYGSNEDVSGAVKYITPATFSREFDESINILINNTLTQSGANEVALGDSRADNATALATMRNAALLPLQIVKKKYYNFLEEVARIWTDFWITHYGKRRIKQEKNGVCSYIPFDGARYLPLIISTKIGITNALSFNPKEQLETLFSLFDKGIITKAELLERIPEGMVPNIKKIDFKETEVSENDGI